MAETKLKTKDFIFHIERRQALLNSIKKQFPNSSGLVVLFAGFEREATAFNQESSFYYMTGLNEPGIVLVMSLQGKSTLYIPNCSKERSKWMFSDIELTAANAPRLGFDSIEVLGAECTGYQFHPFFPKSEYDNLLQLLKTSSDAQQKIFTLNPNNASEYIDQRLILQRISLFVPEITPALVDISPLVAEQRRIKNMKEIELMYRAAEITMLAQEAAANAIAHDTLECEVQASLEYIFTASGARPSFASIVGGGKNSTILHYTVNNGVLKNGDLVIVDIGAEYEHYCADLTRTYPVSGKFTDRQRQVYNVVLETQEYIASLAKPGMWLNNKEVPEKSLNHLAREFMAKKGYEKYFVHGIGHYLGLDVHDVGSYKTALQEGDMITIEPGIYIPEERIGVRIEDNYWVVADGVVCLSEPLPKTIEDIEEFMRSKDAPDDLDEEDDINVDEDDFEFNEA